MSAVITSKPTSVSVPLSRGIRSCRRATAASNWAGDTSWNASRWRATRPVARLSRSACQSSGSKSTSAAVWFTADSTGATRSSRRVIGRRQDQPDHPDVALAPARRAPVPTANVGREGLIDAGQDLGDLLLGDQHRGVGDAARGPPARGQPWLHLLLPGPHLADGLGDPLRPESPIGRFGALGGAIRLA